MYKFINLQYLKTMSEGDLDMEKVLLGLLLEEPIEEMKKMIDLADKSDYTELKKVSHKMKSTLSFVGNEEIINLNADIEKRSINNISTEELPKMTQDLLVLYKKMLPEIQAAHDSI